MSSSDRGETNHVLDAREHEPARNFPLVLLTLFVSIAVLYFARAVIIPLAVGLIVSYALTPVVDLLQKLHIPRSLSAAVLLLSIVFGVGAAALALQDEAVSLIETLPDAAQKLQESVNKAFAVQGKTIEQMQRAAEQIARATESTPSRAPPGVTRVQVEQPRLDVRRYLLTNAVDAISAIGTGLLVLFLAFFLLASGDTFRRKWVQLSGPTLARKRVTVQVMDEIGRQIQRYLGVQLLTSVIAGVASGLAFWAIGLEYAVVWGIVAGVLNFVPYVGTILVMGGTALVALLQFGTVKMALAVAGITLVIHGLQNWLTPWLVSRANQMNAVVVFASLLFWGWLWGAWGLLLGLPIMMVVKAICDHVEEFKPVGEFMGE